MSWGRDVREPDLTMSAAPVAGGLEPRLLADDPRGDPGRGRRAGRRRTSPSGPTAARHDAGVALVRAHGTLGAAVTAAAEPAAAAARARPSSTLAGVRARPGTPAAGAARRSVVAERAPRPGRRARRAPCSSPRRAAPGRRSRPNTAAPRCPARSPPSPCSPTAGPCSTTADDLGGLAPFGRRRRPPAELWSGSARRSQPAGLLALAVRLAAPARAR